jgi:hypothetical protein
MFRLRSAAVIAVMLSTAGSGFAVSAAAADQPAACDAATPPGLTWSTPSFLAWGRQMRIGANVAAPGSGPGYADKSVALSVNAGSVVAAPDPIAHDLEFVLHAPAGGSALHASATWTMVDATGTARCGQSAAVNVPIGLGRSLQFTPKAQRDGITWASSGIADCHDVALQAITLTVQQGSVTRHLSAADQCQPAGTQRVSTPDWELALANGQFVLTPLSAHSSLRARLRYALRVGPRRVASGSLSLVRVYRPERLIVVSDQAFQSVCVHGLYQPKWYGNTVGCKVPGVLSTHLSLA